MLNNHYVNKNQHFGWLLLTFIVLLLLRIYNIYKGINMKIDEAKEILNYFHNDYGYSSSIRQRIK